MIRLYDYELSGNCYKIRLMASILGLPYEIVPIDFYPGREHRSAWFLKINPLGQLPVIEDDGFVLRDAQAILTYLAERYDASGLWYPRGDARLVGQVAQWLAFSDAITATASAARLHDGFFYDSTSRRRGRGRTGFSASSTSTCGSASRMDATGFAKRPHPTIAELACFPYVALSEEGGVSRQDYPAIRRWCDRVRRISGFVVMSGVFPGSRARNPTRSA
jgi:glutathione S-transferase